MTKQSTAESADSLSRSLEVNDSRLRDRFGISPDLLAREFQAELDGGEILRGTAWAIDGISNSAPLLQALFAPDVRRSLICGSAEEWLDLCRARILPEGEIHVLGTLAEVCSMLLDGHTVLFADGSPHALAVATKDVKARSIEEPNVQSVVRGPREGFTEVLAWNIAMLRRKIASPDLRFEPTTLGTVTNTAVAIVYIRDIVSPEVLQEVKDRMATIDMDSILESNYIEEYIQDRIYTPFPTVFNSERPDVVAAGLLEGRVAIMVDGTPFALLVPALFSQFFQSSEDYYQRADFSTLIHLLRFLSFLLATLTPSFYIAITTFHQEMLPTTLLYNLASQREGVPFPAFIEALLMEVTFEILREASVRMPKTIGQSISIVGTLVVGQAAVDAGLVSAAMVIVVSITAIANFVLPAFNMGIAARIIRFGLMTLAASFGLYGVFMGIIALVLHLCSLHSFSVPYMAPLAPYQRDDQKDTLFRLPIPWMKNRPISLKPQKLRRQQ
ncbi:Spore germination protein GerKA [Paenibacillus pasadenensis]|uniref:Spore germination protein GerKA n=1 Tax=Paenibacillus pasadenensis TaxID=217090 RepID=A0A2N5N9X4_9BACL|nr:spore germination protein [Paenibacillus pasadenensis]PLT47161.1 Spore germination protein GerKA [Paenibacillus pasadenensis]